MEYIINELKKNGIIIERISMEDKKFYFTIYNNRVFFIKNLNGVYVDSLLEDTAFIGEYITSDKFNKMIEEQTSIKDKQKVFDKLDLMAVLWDLYIIGIHLLDSNAQCYKQEEISKIERNKFIARKIIVEDKKDEVINKLLEIFKPEEGLEKIITENTELSMERVFKNILKENNTSSIKIEGVENLIQLEEYLDKIKLNIDELKARIERGDYFEN